jgi:hypothetical protein
MKNALSKNEMKKIMAGSNGNNMCCGAPDHTLCYSCGTFNYCPSGSFTFAC